MADTISPPVPSTLDIVKSALGLLANGIKQFAPANSIASSIAEGAANIVGAQPETPADEIEDASILILEACRKWAPAGSEVAKLADLLETALTNHNAGKAG